MKNTKFNNISFIKALTLILFLFGNTLQAAFQAITVNGNSVVINTNNTITFTNNISAGNVAGTFSGDGSGIQQLQWITFDSTYLVLNGAFAGGGTSWEQVPIQPRGGNAQGGGQVGGVRYSVSQNNTSWGERSLDCVGKIIGTNMVCEYTFYSTNYYAAAFRPLFQGTFVNASNYVASFTMTGGNFFTNTFITNGYATYTFTNPVNIYSATVPSPGFTTSIIAPTTLSLATMDSFSLQNCGSSTVFSNTFWLIKLRVRFQQ